MALAQRSPPGSTTLSEMENDVLMPGDPPDNLGLGGCGGPSHAAPQTAAQPIAFTAVSAAASQGGSGTPGSSCLPLPARQQGMRGETVDGGGKDGGKGP